MPLKKSPSQAAFVSNLKAELAAGKPRDQALAIAYSVKRRSRADGGSIFDYSGVGEALPESIGKDVPVRDLAVTVPKVVMWDLPHRAVEHASQTAPGLRREDFTDIPPDTSPDPRSPLGGIGVKVPKFGAQPVDPLVGDSLEAATNVMGGTAFGAPAGAVGAGPARRGMGEIDRVLAAEKAAQPCSSR